MAGAGDSGTPPDPMMLRALTHPLRWKLIDLLRSETTVTVTRCAEVLAESTASCSYHLGMLAKYGYIEPVTGRPGREKPWRLTEREGPLSLAPPGLDDEGAMASEAALEAFIDHEVAGLKDRLRRRDREPEKWQQAGRLASATCWLTAEEMDSVGEQFMQIIQGLPERQQSAGRQPTGVREIRLFIATTVAPRRPPVSEQRPPVSD
jgi:Helix-turn-helix domain